MSYLDNFSDQPKVLVFNDGETGVVKNCKVTIERKGEDENERAPEYKLFVFDEEQIKNTNSDDVTIYPVNKGFFYQDFVQKGTKKENYLVNELKHLLRTFGHSENEEGKIIPERSIKDFNDFMDYTMEYIRKNLNVNSRYDVVVSYGTEEFAKKFLQLDGSPWYIGVSGTKLSLKKNAVTERPEPDEEQTDNQQNNLPDDDSPWV